MSEQSNLKRHQHCPMRTHVGNCIIIGGFCTSIREDICDALHKSFQMGTRSRAVDKANDDAISRDYLEELYQQTLIPKEMVNTDVELGINIGIDKMHDVIKNAPSVLPKRSCYRCGLREDCEDSRSVSQKRGEWQDSIGGIYFCSNCKSSFTNIPKDGYWKPMWIYCPNCGAKMKG